MTGAVVWLTGLPASGKSTFAGRLRDELRERGITPCLLDSDELRSIIGPQLGYSDGDRAVFYAILARLAAELSRQGQIVVVAATANLRAYRAYAREVAPRFVEVWITTPLEECRRRDPKGLYANAERSPYLPGVSAPYEEPLDPEIRSCGADDRVALEQVIQKALGAG
jgi:adenylylsulfate kinase